MRRSERPGHARARLGPRRARREVPCGGEGRALTHAILTRGIRSGVKVKAHIGLDVLHAARRSGSPLPRPPGLRLLGEIL